MWAANGQQHMALAYGTILPRPNYVWPLSMNICAALVRHARRALVGINTKIKAVVSIAPLINKKNNLNEELLDEKNLSAEATESWIN